MTHILFILQLFRYSLVLTLYLKKKKKNKASEKDLNTYLFCFRKPNHLY